MVSPSNHDDRDAVISIRGLVNGFGGTIIHDHLDLDVYRGEILGVVGGSGSGKSVLLRSIVGLNRPESGSIKVFGQETADVDAEDFHGLQLRWGVLFQEGALFSAETVAQNIQVPMRRWTRMSQEPTSGLDPISAAQFDELVRNLQQSLGLTVFMVTHDIDSLRATTDRIAVLVDKKIKVGTIETLVKDPQPWIHEYFSGPRGRAALADHVG